jgi:hypothetical protein
MIYLPVSANMLSAVAVIPKARSCARHSLIGLPIIAIRVLRLEKFFPGTLATIRTS